MPPMVAINCKRRIIAALVAFRGESRCYNKGRLRAATEPDPAQACRVFFLGRLPHGRTPVGGWACLGIGGRRQAETVLASGAVRWACLGIGGRRQELVHLSDTRRGWACLGIGGRRQESGNGRTPVGGWACLDGGGCSRASPSVAVKRKMKQDASAHFRKECRFLRAVWGALNTSRFFLKWVDVITNLTAKLTGFLPGFGKGRF